MKIYHERQFFYVKKNNFCNKTLKIAIKNYFFFYENKLLQVVRKVAAVITTYRAIAKHTK